MFKQKSSVIDPIEQGKTTLILRWIDILAAQSRLTLTAAGDFAQVGQEFAGDSSSKAVSGGVDVYTPDGILSQYKAFVSTTEAKKKGITSIRFRSSMYDPRSGCIATFFGKVPDVTKPNTCFAKVVDTSNPDALDEIIKINHVFNQCNPKNTICEDSSLGDLALTGPWITIMKLPTDVVVDIKYSWPIAAQNTYYAALDEIETKEAAVTYTATGIKAQEEERRSGSSVKRTLSTDVTLYGEREDAPTWTLDVKSTSIKISNKTIIAYTISIKGVNDANIASFSAAFYNDSLGPCTSGFLPSNTYIYSAMVAKNLGLRAKVEIVKNTEGPTALKITLPKDFSTYVDIKAGIPTLKTNLLKYYISLSDVERKNFATSYTDTGDIAKADAAILAGNRKSAISGNVEVWADRDFKAPLTADVNSTSYKNSYPNWNGWGLVLTASPADAANGYVAYGANFPVGGNLDTAVHSSISDSSDINNLDQIIVTKKTGTSGDVLTIVAACNFLGIQGATVGCGPGATD